MTTARRYVVASLVLLTATGCKNFGTDTQAHSPAPAPEENPPEENAPPACPSGYVKVPGSAIAQEFCVAKYEMKLQGVADPWTPFRDDLINLGNSPLFDRAGTPRSSAAGLPWAGLSRDAAIARCQALGAGYDLISNDRWQAVARNIASVGSNWSGGSAGSGDLNRGHSEGAPSAPLAAGDDAQPCVGYEDGRTCSGSSWHVNRRTHTLSNGEVVWDLAGNLMEWIKEDLTVTESGYVFEVGAPTQALFGPGASFADHRNLGFIFSGGPSVAIRGGLYEWDSAEYTGLFATDLGGRNIAANDGQDPTVGFRCVYSP